MDQHQDKYRAVPEAMKTEGVRFDNSVGLGRALRVVTLARLCGDADFRAVVAEQEASASGWHEEDRQTIPGSRRVFRCDQEMALFA